MFRSSLHSLLRPFLRIVNRNVVVFRSGGSQAPHVGGTFRTGSLAAMGAYGAGGKGYHTMATLRVGLAMFFPSGTNDSFCQFVDELAGFAQDAGCRLDSSSVAQWIKTHTGRVSWPGDFYVHIVDKLIQQHLWRAEGLDV